MKEKQGAFILGYLTIQIIGSHAEHFLNHIVDQGIAVWDIKTTNKDHLEAKIYLKDLQTIRRLRKASKMKIKFKQKSGLPFLRNRLFHNKPLFTGLIISLFVLLLLSNTIWKINIEGVTKELETKIVESLYRNGIHPGALKITMSSPNQIQQLLLDEIPELLWIGVDQKGTTYQLEAVEKIIVEDKASPGPQHMVAKKSGVIQYTYVESGQPVVKINDYVEKGDILVSGKIENNFSNEEDEVKSDYVAARGEIWATTWYTADVVIPLKVEQQEVTGSSIERYQLKLGKYQFTVWPWKREGYPEQTIDSEEKHLNILKYRFPVSVIHEKIHEVQGKQYKRSKQEAIKIGVEQVKQNLLRTVGKNAKIESEIILHETSARGKVKLSLYLTVLENIAQEQSIIQGD